MLLTARACSNELVVDEHVGGDDQVEPARHLGIREPFEHDIQLHAADVENRLRPKVDRSRPHIAGGPAGISPTVPVPMRSPKRRQYSTSAESSREPALSCSSSRFRRYVSRRLARCRASRRCAMTRGLMSSAVTARALRQPQTPKRVGECERLDHLHGVDVVALRLVDEVEPRADNGDTPDRTDAGARRDRVRRRAPARGQSRRACDVSDERPRSR